MSNRVLKNDVFLRALFRKKVPYTPIWLMRQAGRYLPEYRKLRDQAGSFMNLAKNPDLSCEITLQPLERYSLDAAILFTDILVLPHAMGLDLAFSENYGPYFRNPIRTENHISKLSVPDMDQLNYVFQSIHLIQKELNGKVPLIGFSGSPWTLAFYMVEGSGKNGGTLIRSMLYSCPELLHQILEINTQSIIIYLNAQIESGVEVVMIFDTWGGILADSFFQKFSLNYIRKVLKNLNLNNQKNPRVPTIVFVKCGNQWIKDIASIGCDAISLDWTANLQLARAQTKDSVAFQGNLDPAVLLADNGMIRSEARRILNAFGPIRSGGHIFNLGHGVLKSTPPDAISELVDEVHTYKT